MKVTSLLLLQVLRSIARACERSFPRGAYVDIETDARSRRTKPLFGPGARTILPVEFKDAGSRFSLKLRPQAMLDHDQTEVIHHNLEQALFELDHEALIVDETDTLLDAQRQLCDRLLGLLAEHAVGFPECDSTGFVRFDEEPGTGVLWLTLHSDVASALIEGEVVESEDE